MTNGFRVELEKDNETLGKKIRLAKMQRIPYLIIAGEKEIEENDITVENRGNEKGEKMELLKFIEKITS
ncbi:hypothetical protein K0B03_02230 [Patescibacteria group bacterium]|nr:hypothetical protein [Patescibacteria group bacterium]